MATILVADDDGHIREVVKYSLEKAGYRVVEAADGDGALAEIEKTTPDLVILDIVMPGRDGIDVCRELRKTRETPVVFLTSRDDEIDRVLGLELGADDYITKPFSPRELVARVKAVLRRTLRGPTTSENTVRNHGSLCLDLDRHACTYCEVELDLTVTEFAIVETLMGRPGKVYSRGELVDRAYGHGHHVTERTIDSHIRRVRKKLSWAGDGGEELIETVHGVGYRLS